MKEWHRCKPCLVSGCKYNWHTDQIELQTLIRPETPPPLVEWENQVLSEWAGIAGCMNFDGRNVNVAEELNRLEKELSTSEP